MESMGSWPFSKFACTIHLVARKIAANSEITKPVMANWDGSPHAQSTPPKHTGISHRYA